MQTSSIVKSKDKIIENESLNQKVLLLWEDDFTKSANSNS